MRALAARLAGEGAHAGFDVTDGLSAAEGEVVALVYSAELRLARLRAGMASASAAEAGRWADPVFSVDVLRITESVARPWIVAPGLSFTVPISGRLRAERVRAEAGARAELERVALAEWDVRMEVRELWAAWSAAAARAEAAGSAEPEIGALAASAERLAEAGEMTRAEAALFALARAEVARDGQRAEAEARELAMRIRGAMGLAPGAEVEMVPGFEGFDADEAWDEGRLLTHPEIAALAEAHAASEAGLLAEVRKQYPDLTIGPAYEWEEGQSRVGFGAGIPIPTLNMNRQGIAEARAAREIARAAYEAALERITGEVSIARARAEAARARREMFEVEVAPMVDRQLAEARRVVELGEGSAVVLLESWRAARGAQEELIAARLEEALAGVALARAMGPGEGERKSEEDGR